MCMSSGKGKGNMGVNEYGSAGVAVAKTKHTLHDDTALLLRLLADGAAGGCLSATIKYCFGLL